MSRHLLSKALLAGLIAASAPILTHATAATAASSAPGTIVYIKNHNVWISTGDGSGQRALTKDGTFALPYGSPTQSDAGIVVATHGPKLVRMNQQGTVLTTLDPHPLPSSVGIDIDGNIAHAAISPNGQRIAYTFTKYLNPTGASAGYRSATGYTAADRLTDPAPLKTTFFWEPSWVGNNRTLQSGGYGSQLQLQDLGEYPRHWFDDEDIYEPSTDLGNAELSRDGKLLAAVRGYGEESWIMWYDVVGDATTGAPPSAPNPVCQIGPAEITNPTWAPDNDGLAWQENDGVWTRTGTHDCSRPSTLLLPGASEPDWSPAPLSAPAQERPVKNLVAPRITGAAKLGKVLRADTGRWSVAGTRTVAWFRDGKRIGRGSKHKVVRGDRGHRLWITVTLKAPGKAPASARSKAIKVRR